MGVEARVAEEAADEQSYLVARHGEACHAVAAVAMAAVVEAEVAREEARAWEAQQERDDGLVGESLLGDVDSDLARPNPLALEELALILRDVLVQQDHAGTGSKTYSST